MIIKPKERGLVLYSYKPACGECDKALRALDQHLTQSGHGKYESSISEVQEQLLNTHHRLHERRKEDKQLDESLQRLLETKP